MGPKTIGALVGIAIGLAWAGGWWFGARKMTDFCVATLRDLHPELKQR